MKVQFLAWSNLAGDLISFIFLVFVLLYPAWFSNYFMTRLCEGVHMVLKLQRRVG